MGADRAGAFDEFVGDPLQRSQFVRAEYIFKNQVTVFMIKGDLLRAKHKLFLLKSHLARVWNIGLRLSTYMDELILYANAPSYFLLAIIESLSSKVNVFSDG